MKNIYFISLFVLLPVLFSCGRKTNETKPSRKDITETVFASGTLEPENKYNLIAQSEGYIIALKFNNNDEVKAGQVLAIIDNKTNSINAISTENLTGIAAQNASSEGPTLKQAQSNLQLLKDKFEQDSVQFSRYQKLIQSNSVSKLELENVKLAFENSKINYLNAGQNFKLLKQQTEQQLILQRSQRDVNSVSNDNNEVKAVLEGKIYKKVKEVGDYVHRGDIIAIIGNSGDMYAKLSIDENNISKIKLGQEVIIQLNVDKEKTYKAELSEIIPSFDEPTQSFICKAKFIEPITFNIEGTQLQANITVDNKKNALVIPKSFLGYGNLVKTKDKGDVLIKSGFVSGDWVEVLGGLDENTVILSENVK
ncbi:MAG TPA: HlyD family efflux transporter periplasmic adaptor subunit [Bacteroidia bacterium]|jgi:RND family efflux transporter MFP subunit|nr:HlyD family efflux transporter periplasmic adaptor subunit [Bacteroidia bacterium]